jgi:hypothetical protein
MGIEHAEIRDEMLFVVAREHCIARRKIGDIGIEEWLLLGVLVVVRSAGSFSICVIRVT